MTTISDALTGFTFTTCNRVAIVHTQMGVSHLKTGEFTQSSGCSRAASNFKKEPKHKLRNHMPETSAFQLILHRSHMTHH